MSLICSQGQEVLEGGDASGVHTWCENTLIGRSEVVPQGSLSYPRRNPEEVSRRAFPYSLGVLRLVDG